MQKKSNIIQRVAKRRSYEHLNNLHQQKRRQLEKGCNEKYSCMRENILAGKIVNETLGRKNQNS